MRCVVIDDENMGRKLLEENVRQLPYLELVASCKNAFEGMEVLQTQAVDLIFLDIQMPGMLGTQFLQTLKNRPFVIFVTAYDNYAVESYQLDAIDYLMKPTSLERFSQAANKAYHLFLQAKNAISTPLELVDDFFFANVEYSLVRISIPKVTHIEGLKDYVKIFMEGEKLPILTKMTMKALELRVAPHGFMRVHKSFIVNLRKIESIKQLRIKIGVFGIPISDSHVSELMERINYAKS